MRRKMCIVLCVALSVMLTAACGKKGLEETADPIVFEKGGETPEGKKIKAGTSQEDAAVLALGEKVEGTVEGGSYAWFKFTTGTVSDVRYNVTFVNATADAGKLRGGLYDEYGEELDYQRADGSGKAATIGTEDLEADTTYYICLTPETEVDTDYTLVVADPEGKADGGQTEETAADGQIVPGSSQADAVLLPIGTKVFGTVEKESYAWFAFTTGDNADTTYNITVVNTTADAQMFLEAELYDEYGEDLGRVSAEKDGAPVTISAEELETNTTYYICLNPYTLESLGYSIVIKDPEAQDTAYRTAGEFSEARGAAGAKSGTVTAGTNVNEAVMIGSGSSVSGKVQGGEFNWFSFMTDDTAEAVYKITAVNTTAEASMFLDVRLYDEYGEEMQSVHAGKTGEPETITAKELKPNTVYYIKVNPYTDENLNYTLSLKSPEEKNEENMLVFEIPFEINETQVQFVPDQAELLDEAKAKEVLKPVAEAILAAPEHSVMIAGTTATSGSQDEAAALSEQRAQTVKRLLADEYKVPESQMKTVGLGYEQDPFERGKDIDGKGNFVESEAKKNRRVVILDAEDPIAQKLLK